MIDSILKLAAAYLESGNLLVYVLVYIAGLITSLTPCIYPVIPLTIAYFGAQVKDSKKELFTLALTYVIGMSLVYAALGMIAALTGSLFGRIATHPLTLIFFGNVCLLLGLSLMDVFTISLPSFLKIGQSGTKRKGLLGSFLIGASAGLIVGPCTTPILGLVLTYVATKQSIFFGGSLLFVFSFGMGTLLLAIAMSSGLLHKLPKAGNWMVVLKKVCGFIIILLAEFFLFKAGQMWF